MANILVVDDEESIRFTFNSFLSMSGHEVFTAESYPTAMDIIFNQDLDLIFADIILENYSGINILRAVKERGIKCPVIIITGLPDINTASESVRLGAFDYLKKPIVKDNLLHVTKIALDHKALIDEKEKLEREKERFQKHLEAIFLSVKDAIITVDNMMQVTEANRALEDIFQISPSDIIGKPYPLLPHPCLTKCTELLEKTLKKSCTIKDYRIECTVCDLTKRVVEVTCSSLLDHNKQQIGALILFRDVTRLETLEKEVREQYKFHNMIGKSKRMQEIYRLMEDLAQTDTTVLIMGESGTGKECIAKALHHSGTRSAKPLIMVNCSALSENLLESELFGHVKGAFTGAIRDRIGRFETANEGTILLDEIGDISPLIQLKLLRVIQEKEIERVGDGKTIKVDVRIIAATNKNLKERVRDGYFREDLYYRLKILQIHLPPLREKREDIPLLVKHFCNRFNKRFKKDISGITEEVLNLFMAYPWPGNVRELEHTIEHAFVICHDNQISLNHIPLEIRDFFNQKNKPIQDANKLDYIKIQKILEKTGGNKAKAARLIGISRQTLYRQIKANIKAPRSVL